MTKPRTEEIHAAIAAYISGSREPFAVIAQRLHVSVSTLRRVASAYGIVRRQRLGESVLERIESSHGEDAMKPVKQKHLARLPLSGPCRRCGRQFKGNDRRLSQCPVCHANFMVRLHLSLERAKEENSKRLRLFQLRLALVRASRWLAGVDTAALDQAIDAARSTSAARNASTTAND